MKKIVLHSVVFVLMSVCIAPVIADAPLEEPAPVYDERYMMEYPKNFFETGGEMVKYNKNLYLRIAIVVDNRSDMNIHDIIRIIFSVSPLDRYRHFFVFLDNTALERSLRLRNYFLDAYDSYGRKIPGGYEIENSAVRAGLIVLKVDDSEFGLTGTLGYSTGKRAVAQRMTVLHELGHALANLADEYSIRFDTERREAMEENMAKIGVSYQHRQHRAWNQEQANVDYRTRKYLKWQPLIDQGFIEDIRVKRVQMEDDADIGRFVIPTERCIMNRIVDAQIGFCPVCQLQIIESICRLTGVSPPWEE